MSATFEVEASLVTGLIVGVLEAKECWPLAELLSCLGGQLQGCYNTCISGEEGMMAVLPVIREAVLESSLRGGAGICAAVRSGRRELGSWKSM